MSKLKFQPARKSAAKARIGIVGPSGSGKTWSSLAIASGLGKRIAVIDTERKSASLYADQYSFDALELEEHSPELYVEAIRAAEAAGYDVLVIDSLSHAWMGRDGALEQVDQVSKRSKSGNTFAAWRDITPKHNALVDAMLSANMHIIATMRAKTEWVLEDGPGGKKTPRKVGLEAVQRSGMEYEFTIVGDIDLDHNLVISKTRMSALADKIIAKPGQALGEKILAWLSDGTPAPASAPPSQPSLPAAAPPGRPPLGTEAEVRAELAAMVALFGGREEFTRKVCAWPSNLAAARSAIALAKERHAQAVDEASTPFDDIAPEPLAQPIDEAAVAQPASAAPPQGRAPEAAPPPIVDTRLTVVPVRGPGGAVLFASIQEFWARAKATGRKADVIGRECQELLGADGPGKLTPLQRAVYCAVVESDGTAESVALDLIDLYGCELRKAGDEVWTMYLEVLSDRAQGKEK